jgi:hypothetical protein
VPITAEDGTGRADASTYQEASAVALYLNARGLSAAWSALSADEQDIACVLATDYLDNAERFVYRGARLVATQALAWPRRVVLDDDGYAVTGVPTLLRRAHAEVCGVLAVRKASRGLTPQALQPILARGGRVVSQSGAGFSQTFASDAPSEDRLVMVHGWLKPLVTSPRDPVALSITFNTDGATPFDVET